ncbi:MAG: hypothetical protein IJR61_08090 [Clostridia bacterium]|nr:hypothetical protein [Clostridia bacterium]
MKKREKCIFGMHFDFHAKPDEYGLGGDFLLEEYEKMLDEVRPDVIQVDTKGHPGIASYPSACGNSAPGMAGDMLAALRELTAKKGVFLYSHYSGVWDVFQTDKHEEYRPVYKNIEYKGETSVFSSYADDLLIPQLKELAERGIDGVWIDGECWATQADYSQAARNAYVEKFGKEPDIENDRAGYENFCREAFYDYVRRYVSEVHKYYPDFEIASNWLGTTFCPLEDDLGVDFITGDYDPFNSVNTARFQSKALVRCTKHWELLSWGFNIQNGYYADKSADQVKQEISVIYHCGGAASLYYTAIRGNIKSYLIPVWKEIGLFAKDLGRFTQGNEVLPEIAVLQSVEGFYKDKKRLFSTWEDGYASDMEGVTLALSDLGVGVEVASTYVLKKNLYSYSAVAVTDFPAIEGDVKREIVKYVEQGGKLLLFGANAAANFADVLGLEKLEKCPETQFIVNGSEKIGITETKVALPKDRAELWFESNYLMGKKTIPALWATDHGMGRVVVVPFAFGEQYKKNGGDPQSRFLEKALQIAHFKPFARAYGHYKVDLVPARKDGKILLHLLNLCGTHADINVRNDGYIPSVENVTVKINRRRLADLLKGDGEIEVTDRSGKKYPAETDGDTIGIKVGNIKIQTSLQIEAKNRCVKN